MRDERIRETGEEITEKVWNQYEKGVQFKQGLKLYDTVKVNEDFYLGKQWEGVQSNGLPTPVFNFIKLIVLFRVASTATDNLKINVSPLASMAPADTTEIETLCGVVKEQFEAIVEQNKLGKLVREFVRAAAVDGDSCFYSWFDPEVETGQTAKGAIRTEILENSRVIFGNPNTREVQVQPYIIVSRREMLEDVRDEAKDNGCDPDEIIGDSDETNNRFDAMTDGKVTTLMRFRKDKKTGTIWAVKTVHGAVVRKEWDTGLKLYPIAWMSWEKVVNCCHGQAIVTGLIPNQVFVNKMFAMVMISLMTTAYPKVIYDKTCITRWDNSVGKAIPVGNLNGRSLKDVAGTIDPAAISPQVSQFIELAIRLTKEFSGATDAALGNVNPENTSAILATQKAAQVPIELTRQDLHQAIEDLGTIWKDIMRVNYGTRYVEMPLTEQEKAVYAELGVPAPDKEMKTFDFSVLDTAPLATKFDVGNGNYWSEIAQLNTLDNLLMNKQISLVDYLERIPADFITNKQELIDALKAQSMPQTGGALDLGAPMAGMQIDPALSSGYNTLERKATQQDALRLLQ